jgi:hypothetical protein
MAVDAAVADRLRPDRPRLVPAVAVVVAAAVLAVGGDVGGLLAREGGAAPGGDPAGPLVAVLVLGAWLLADAPYAFVVGQVGLVVGLDGGPSSTPVAQAALVGVLVADVAATHRGAERLQTALVLAATAVVLLAIVEYEASTSVAAAAVLAVTALIGYTIHRYERLRLGLVGDAG